MDINRNGNENSINRQKNLIAKSVEELDSFFTTTRSFFELEYSDIKSTNTNFKNYITVSLDSELNTTEIKEIKSHTFNTVKLQSSRRDRNWLIFIYKIQKWEM
jgi:CHASE1-domain containing sensor protein